MLIGHSRSVAPLCCQGEFYGGTRAGAVPKKCRVGCFFVTLSLGPCERRNLRTLQLCGFGRRQFVRSDRGRSACRIIIDFASMLSIVDDVSN